MNNRIIFVDIARGLAILIVINWHILNYHSPYTDSWTMPIFFIIMGVFYKQESSFMILLKKKTNTLLIPHLFFSVPALIIGLCNKPIIEIVKKIVNPYESINGSSWFLVCMFGCYIIFYVVNMVSKGSRNKNLLVCLFISIMGFYMNDINISGYRVVLPFYFSTSMTCMAFIAAGYYLRDVIMANCKITATIYKSFVLCVLSGGGNPSVRFSTNGYDVE